MQAMKDEFYRMLRERVSAGNAARTVVVRGAVRPGVLVVENELPGASVAGLVGVFGLRWTSANVDATGLVTLGCAIGYATDGSALAAGMDRGRALTAMDEELVAALAGGQGAGVFWGPCGFGPVVMAGERMERTATVEVYGYA